MKQKNFICVFIVSLVFLITFTAIYNVEYGMGFNDKEQENLSLLNTSNDLKFQVNEYKTASGFQDIPTIGAGIIIIIIWVVIAFAAMGSSVIRWENAAILLLLANIGMIIFWYSSLALTKISYLNFETMIYSPTYYSSNKFEIGENEGLIFYASKYHNDDDPTHTFHIYIWTAVGGILVVDMEFGMYSYDYGWDMETGYLPLSAGSYVMALGDGDHPLSEFTIDVRKPGFFSDYSSVYLAEAGNIILTCLSVVGMIVAVSAIYKNRKKK